MKRLAIVFIVLAAGFGGVRSAKADTVTFTFISAPDSAGTYIDATGTLTGSMTYFTDPTDLNLFMVDSGTVTVTSNLTPSPWPGDPAQGKIPEFNGYSDTSYSKGGWVLSDPLGMGVNLLSWPFEFGVALQMPGNPADGGDFTLGIEASGINGTANNATIVGTDDGAVGYYYGLQGTLTVDGQLGSYDLTPTPEPSSWLLMGSGVLFLGLLVYQKPRTALMVHR